MTMRALLRLKRSEFRVRLRRQFCCVSGLCLLRGQTKAGGRGSTAVRTRRAAGPGQAQPLSLSATSHTGPAHSTPSCGTLDFDFDETTFTLSLLGTYKVSSEYSTCGKSWSTNWIDPMPAGYEGIIDTGIYTF